MSDRPILAPPATAAPPAIPTPPNTLDPLNPPEPPEPPEAPEPSEPSEPPDIRALAAAQPPPGSPQLPARVHLVANPDTWIEGEAVRQLEATARLLGMRLCVGMPDLHPGKGHPIGAAMVTSGVVYPHLVGGDIGCG